MVDEYQATLEWLALREEEVELPSAFHLSRA
jgi:hypothetical protein